MRTHLATALRITPYHHTLALSLTVDGAAAVDVQELGAALCGVQAVVGRWRQVREEAAGGRGRARRQRQGAPDAPGVML